MKATKIYPPTEGKIRIQGVGTFNPAQMKAEGIKKQDLAAYFTELVEADSKAAVEKVWAAMQGKEIIEEPAPEQQTPTTPTV